MYKAEILADSVNPTRARITTMRITFPRIALADFSKHRMFAFSAESNRAIPTEKMIEAVRNDPFIPEFGKRIKGMGSGESLNGLDKEQAERNWLNSRDQALASAEAMLYVGKEHANCLLEPFQWITIIVTATDWLNYFALRSFDFSNPRPELAEITELMKKAYDLSQPTELKYGDWYIPLVTKEERHNHYVNECIIVSAGRIARISYSNQDKYEDWDKSFDRGNRLKEDWHLVPFEHQAQAMQFVIGRQNYYGCFHSWKPYRKFLRFENNYGAYLKHKGDLELMASV